MLRRDAEGVEQPVLSPSREISWDNHLRIVPA
jgi:hypothetical protein